jgi:hypothetical protein
VVELDAGTIARTRCRAPLAAGDARVRVDVWVDGPILEAFAGGAAIATRLDRHVHSIGRPELAALSGPARFTDVTVTALGPAVTIAPA